MAHNDNAGRAGRFVRLGNRTTPLIEFTIDGQLAQAHDGESIAVAMLTSGRTLRRHEFEQGNRAGFCLMGACQDCWVWAEDGKRYQACITPVSEGLRLLTSPPPAWGHGRLELS